MCIALYFIALFYRTYRSNKPANGGRDRCWRHRPRRHFVPHQMLAPKDWLKINATTIITSSGGFCLLVVQSRTPWCWRHQWSTTTLGFNFENHRGTIAVRQTALMPLIQMTEMSLNSVQKHIFTTKKKTKKKTKKCTAGWKVRKENS